MERDSFVLYTRFYELVRNLTLEQKGMLFDAIHYFANGQSYPINDAATEMAFRFYRNQMEIDFEKWEQVRQKRIEAGRQGGRPKKDENQTKAKKANGFSENQTKAKKTVNVNENVNVNVNDNVNVNENENNTLTSVEATTLPTRTRTTKEVAERNIVPPTLEMVRARCLAMHYTFDPEAFHAYYETRGWMLNNRKKMKDWWAACVTWQKNQQERKQQKPNQYGSNYEDHPTNAELIRQTYELINKAAGKPDYTDEMPF